MGRKKIEVNKGQRFEMLTVIGEVEPHISPCGIPHRKFLFQCDCGNTKEMRLDNLRRGRSKSCGCYNIKKVKQRVITHGLSQHYLYNTWKLMKQRCYNPNQISYYRYGGRGIKVCYRWRYSFPNFLKDMGDRPEGYTLERKNKDGDYTPDNCKWADDTEQANNRNPWGTLKKKKNPNQTQLTFV